MRGMMNNCETCGKGHPQVNLLFKGKKRYCYEHYPKRYRISKFIVVYEAPGSSGPDLFYFDQEEGAKEWISQFGIKAIAMEWHRFEGDIGKGLGVKP